MNQTFSITWMNTQEQSSPLSCFRLLHGGLVGRPSGSLPVTQGVNPEHLSHSESFSMHMAKRGVVITILGLNKTLSFARPRDEIMMSEWQDVLRILCKG